MEDRVRIPTDVRWKSREYGDFNQNIDFGVNVPIGTAADWSDRAYGVFLRRKVALWIPQPISTYVRARTKNDSRWPAPNAGRRPCLVIERGETNG